MMEVYAKSERRPIGDGPQSLAIKITNPFSLFVVLAILGSLPFLDHSTFNNGDEERVQGLAIVPWDFTLIHGGLQG